MTKHVTNKTQEAQQGNNTKAVMEALELVAISAYVAKVADTASKLCTLQQKTKRD